MEAYRAQLWSLQLKGSLEYVIVSWNSWIVVMVQLNSRRRPPTRSKRSGSRIKIQNKIQDPCKPTNTWARSPPLQEPQSADEAIGPSSGLRTTRPSTHRRITVSLFELCRIAHPDGPYAPSGEGSTYLFLRTTILPRLKQCCVLF